MKKTHSILKTLKLAAALLLAGVTTATYAGNATLFKIYLHGLQGPASAPSGPGVPIGVYSTGQSYSAFVVMSDGSVYAAGWNPNGQLGDGTTTNETRFVKVLTGGAASVSAGSAHTAILMTNGTVWTAGDNSASELGDGTTSNRSTFQQVMAGATSVTAGASATYVVKSDGTVWAVGYNANGQLGTGGIASLSTFTQTQTGVQQVVAGYYHTSYLKTDGTVWNAGVGTSGEMGNGTTTSSRTLVETKTGSPYFTGANTISAGYEFTLVTKPDGSTWGWGDNGGFELPTLGGTGHLYANELAFTDSNYTSVIQVAGGGSFSFALRSDGTLWGAGTGSAGQFGTGGTGNLSYFTKVLTNVVQVAAGENFAMALKADGTVWVAGQNNYGQLGLGDTTTRTTWTQVTFQ